MKKLVISKVFSRYPVGRDELDGPDNGERFRREFLLPLLKHGDTVLISFEGVRMCNPSFLEEAFGGLVRVDKLRADDVLERVQFEQLSSSSNAYPKRATQFIKEARPGFG